MNLDLKEEVKKTNEIVINLREQIRQSNVEHERLKEKHASISGGYATIIYKLKRSYDSHDELEKQNSQLLHEKSELSVRAAAGYENLTPRPNLGLLFKELDVVVPEISTSDKVEVLLSELKEFKNKMNRRKLTKRAVLKSPRRSSPNAEVDDSKLSKDRSRDGSFIELAVPTPKNASDRSLHWSTLLKP